MERNEDIPSKEVAGMVHLQMENEAREKGNSFEALSHAERAFGAFVKSGDLVGASQALAAQTITLRHLSEANDNDPNYLIRAKHTAMSGVEIARSAGKPEAVVLPLFSFGRTFDALGDYEQAVKSYQEALETLPQSQYNKQSINADLRVHLEVAKYRNGDASALQRALSALDDLMNSEEAKYEKDVWVSGGHMKIAEALYSTDSDKAREHLEKAREIIDSSPDLKLRKLQLEKLSQRVGLL